DVGEQVERRLIVAVDVDRWPFNEETRNLHPILEREALLAREWRPGYCRSRDRFAAWQIAEVFPDPCPRLLGVEVADDSECGVVRRVVETQELLDVLDRRIGQSGHVADR